MQTQERATHHIAPPAELDTDEKRRNLHTVFKQLRETTPIRYDEDRKCWDFFQYDDCVRILKDPKTFSNKFNRFGTTVENIIGVDPPRHTEFRSLVNKVFTPKAVQDLAPKIRQITNELLDQVITKGSMEVVRDLAGPLPCIVIAELLGVPKEDQMNFKTLSDAFVTGVGDNSEETYQKVLEESQAAQKQLREYFQNLLNKRKKQPQDDLVTLLWQSNLEKQVLSEEEVVNFLVGLLIAGHETTTNLISGGIRALTAMPELQDQLQQNPEKIPSFVEETLRCYSSANLVTRLCVQDVEIQGHLIKAGDIVNTWIISANRDESHFENAQAFVIDRSPNPHISFGSGVHFCLGAPLARLEGHMVYSALMERITNLREAEGKEIIYQNHPHANSVAEYWITFK